MGCLGNYTRARARVP